MGSRNKAGLAKIYKVPGVKVTKNLDRVVKQIWRDLIVLASVFEEIDRVVWETQFDDESYPTARLTHSSDPFAYSPHFTAVIDFDFVAFDLEKKSISEDGLGTWVGDSVERCWKSELVREYRSSYLKKRRPFSIYTSENSMKRESGKISLICGTKDKVELKLPHKLIQIVGEEAWSAFPIKNGVVKEIDFSSILAWDIETIGKIAEMRSSLDRAEKRVFAPKALLIPKSAELDDKSLKPLNKKMGITSVKRLTQAQIRKRQHESLRQKLDGSIDWLVDMGHLYLN